MEPPKGRGVGLFSAAFYGQAGRMRWWLFVCQGNPSREVRTERRAAASDNHAFPLLLFTGLLFVCRMRNIYMSSDQICFPHIAPSLCFVFYSSSSSSSPPLSPLPLQTLHALSKACAHVLEYFWLNLITLSELFRYHLHNAVYYLGGRTLAFVCQHCRKGVVICLWWREMGKLEMT